jgi:signal transduction histidine kinase
MRLRPWSIRVRDTVIATVISAVVLIGTGVAVDLYIRGAAERRVNLAVLRVGDQVRTAVRRGTLPAPIPADPRVDSIHVVDGRGRVVSSTTSAVGRPPITSARPGPDRDAVLLTVCPAHQHCSKAAVMRVVRADGEYFVHTARRMPWVIDTHWLEVAIGAAVLALIGLAAWITWWMVGRTLGPIEAVRAQLAEIGMSDLSRRGQEPARADEIARIARTVNETLCRLEHAVAQQWRFATDVSHELRTPIAGLRAGLEEALMHTDDVDPYSALRAALRKTGRLEAIVTDLLLLARLGTGTTPRKPVDLAELVAGEVGRRDADFHTILTPGVVVNAVPTQLIRLLDNLLDNAESFAAKEIDVEVCREDETAIVTVTDDGPGIPVADRERVFERFTQLGGLHRRDAGGTGLGLAIARDIAQAHGGTLCVEDSPRGARFVLRLPPMADSPADATAGSRTGSGS